MDPVLHSAAAEAFDELADAYDADGAHAALAERLVRLAAGLRDCDPPAMTLDVGTGTGAAARAALEIFPTTAVVAVDISAAMIARARSLTGAVGVRDRISWACAPAVPFPAPDGSADLLLCASTLHFLGTPAFVDWHRVLRAGGLAAFTLPWRDRFRPGPAFAALLPNTDQRIELPGSPAEAARSSWPGFDTITVEVDDRAALFVIRRRA
jgi:ubiquinone/menaquinone biosynthesis C-methylase UbiE